MKRAKTDAERAYLINREIDAIRGTIVRQTMFAEFEKRTHAMAEAGEPLTLESFRGAYRELLDAYFGPRLRHRRLSGTGVPPHPALLQRVLRLQVRHRPVGGDRPCRSGW